VLREFVQPRRRITVGQLHRGHAVPLGRQQRRDSVPVPRVAARPGNQQEIGHRQSLGACRLTRDYLLGPNIRLGGADLILGTAPSSEAIESTVGGLKPRGKLLIVTAPFTPVSVHAMGLLSGKAIAGWPSGSAIDSEDTMAFSALTAVLPRVETFKLEQAEQAFAHMMENRARFRAVLVPSVF
jgi:D-arabinose 1-dehydrogenase-like Zn-dependent alcohol dehydrogenase